MKLIFWILFSLVFHGVVFASNLIEPLYHVGYRTISMERKDIKTKGMLWYPIATSELESPVPTASIFFSYSGKKDAILSSTSKKYPLLLLSHGSGAIVQRLDWIADYFSRRGWIVAGVNHPGNTLEDNSAEGLMQVWKRPAHVSALLDLLLGNPEFKDRIDISRISIAGHSAGGTTALLLGGAKFSQKSLQNPLPFCKPQPQGFDDENCSELKKINTKKYPVLIVEKNYRDPRIKAVVAIDPGFSRSFDSKISLAVPTLFLLADHLKDPSGELFTNRFLNLYPNSQYVFLKDSIHISYVSPCSKKGIDLALPICLGDENGRREQTQRSANEKIWTFLEQVMVN